MKKEIKLYSTLFILALSALMLSGCGAEKNMKKGEKYLAVGEYYDAATQFKRAYQRTAPKEREKRGKIALKVAFCNERINSTQKALAAYSNAIRYNQPSSALCSTRCQTTCSRRTDSPQLRTLRNGRRMVRAIR